MRDHIRNILIEASIPNNLNDNFWHWFGNSKAVDGNGNPLVLFHGTRNAMFKQFKIRKPNEKGMYYRLMETGIWVTPQPEIASRFMRKKKSTFEYYDDQYTTHSGMFPVYISLQKPMEFITLSNYSDALIEFTRSIEMYADKQQIPKLSYHYERDVRAENKAYIDYLKSEGYDGIILHNTKYDSTGGNEKNTQYAVFDGSQIKSIYNNGQWGNNKDIMK